MVGNLKNKQKGGSNEEKRGGGGETSGLRKSIQLKKRREVSNSSLVNCEQS